MAKNKTSQTEVNVTDFINSYVTKEEKKQDAFRLVEMMRKWTGYEPKMWGPTIIGFGSCHYKYASGHEGDMPLLGFSPRKPEFVLYVNTPGKDDKKLLDTLGKYKMGKSCIYIKKLDDLNLDVLEKLSKVSIAYARENLECT